MYGNIVDTWNITVNNQIELCKNHMGWDILKFFKLCIIRMSTVKYTSCPQSSSICIFRQNSTCTTITSPGYPFQPRNSILLAKQLRNSSKAGLSCFAFPKI